MSAARPGANPIPTDPGVYSMTLGAIEYVARLHANPESRALPWSVMGWTNPSATTTIADTFGRCTFTRLEPVPGPLVVIGDDAIATAKRRFDSIAGALLRLIFDDQNPSIEDAVLLTTDRGNVEWLIALADVGFETETVRHLLSCPTEPGIELLKNSEGFDSEPAEYLCPRHGQGCFCHPPVDSEPHVDDRRMVASLRDMEASEELLLKVADRLEELGRHDVILRHQRDKFDELLRAELARKESPDA